jgi:hypothetical protein
MHPHQPLGIVIRRLFETLFFEMPYLIVKCT